MKRGITIVCVVVLAFVLVACGQGAGTSSVTGGSTGEGVATDAATKKDASSNDEENAEANVATGRTYYVFESSSSGGYVTTDPTALVNDYPGSISPEYYLSLVLFDDLRGKICWMGCLTDLTYEVDGDVITLHVPMEPSMDGERLEVDDGTLTMRDERYTTVLRQVDEMPETFEWVLR